MNRREFCAKLGAGLIVSPAFLRSAIADSHESDVIELAPLERDLQPDIERIISANEKRLNDISNLSDDITTSILDVARDKHEGSNALNNSVRKLQNEINALYQLFPDNQLQRIETDGKLESVAFPLVQLSSFMAQGGGVFGNTLNLPAEDQEAMADLRSTLLNIMEVETPGAYNDFKKDYFDNTKIIDARKEQGISPTARPCEYLRNLCL